MFCGSKSLNKEKIRSKEIDRQLKFESKKLAKVQQVLLLGTGESGKTTIIKQMKIIHINGFSKAEKYDKIPSIKQNIHDSIYTLVNSMNKISPPTILHNENSKKSADYILKLGLNESIEYTDEYFDHVKILWDDPGIKQTFSRSNEFQLIDSASHFLDRIEEIRQPNYIPTVQDVLYCRVRTVAISKIEFKIIYHQEEIEFCMYDVGGQRGERKKWISVFEGISAILFLIAASDFDQTLREDDKTNRLQEGFTVFSDIFWSRFVRKAGKIVFLNKQDLLKQKIENGKRLDNYFPEFRNYHVKDKNSQSYSNYEKAKFFMSDKIMSIAQNKPVPETVVLMPDVRVKQNITCQSVYIHFTVATDTNNIKLVFEAIKDIIITKNLIEIGLV